LSVRTEIRRNIRPRRPGLASRLSRSLEVIGTDVDRSAYDFLLVILVTNHGPYLVPFS